MTVRDHVGEPKREGSTEQPPKRSAERFGKRLAEGLGQRFARRFNKARANLFEAVSDRLIARAMRTPYFHLDGYMNRWWLLRIGPRNADGSPKWFGIRIHQILRSDNDRHPHDHPFPYASLILRGGYWEETLVDAAHDWRFTRWRGPGSLLFRRASHFHRLLLPQGACAWTLFVTGPRRHVWGFLVDGVKVPWREYLGVAGTGMNGGEAA